MFPRLVILSERVETIKLDLKEGETFSIGRTESNQLVLPHHTISRQHCLISLVNQELKIEDLDSHNGFFVNNLKVKQHILEHGDKLKIGNYELLFLISEGNDNWLGQAKFDDGILVTKSDIQIIPEKVRLDGDLGLLRRFGKVIKAAINLTELQNKLLEIILEIISAERGAILLFEADLETPKSSSIKPENFNMTISKTVTQRVLREKIALLSNDLSALDSSQSLLGTNITSILCVPIKGGVLYLDTSNASTKFTENQLQMLTAISFLISAALEQFVSISELQDENLRLLEQLQIETNLIGNSRSMEEVLQLIAKVSKSEANVLITGESGTGKELAAQTIHRNSRRAHKPFIAINCAVLNENLMESEMFGHERGAFTGAINQKKGKFEIAEGGTLFLDEISEMPVSLQAKLLRVLQEKEFERVGGTRTIKTDVRIVVATNRNLMDEVEKGNFRQDLFFRLNVVQIKLPPLRQRKSDITLLAQHFVQKYASVCHRKITGISKEAKEILQNYEWRGNVRELENVIERAIVIGSTETILPEDLPTEIIENAVNQSNLTPNFHQQVKEAKSRIVQAAINNANGNYSEAARNLGIHPNNLHRVMRELGMKEKNS